jgi:ankyrin repeat protein
MQNVYQKNVKIISLAIVLSLSNQNCISFSRQPTTRREKLFDKDTIKPTDANSLTFLLFKAIDDGNAAGVRELIALGADVNKPYAFDITAYTPLLKAIENGQIDVVRCLVEHGANVNAEYNFESVKFTPLFVATNQNNFEIVQHLVEHGANVNATREDTFLGEKTTLLHDAARESKRLVEYLVEHGADVNALSFFTFETGTALLAAVSHGQIDIARYLVEHGAQVNSTRNENSPLETAIYNKDLPMIQYLLTCGAHVNALNSMGLTFLHQAALQDSLDIVKLLVNAGADCNMLNEFDELILDYIANEEIKTYLVSKGAKSNGLRGKPRGIKPT